MGPEGMPPALRAGMVRHLNEDHLVPEQVGAMAKAADVKRVVLSHLAPGLDSETSTASYADGARAVFKGPVVVAADLMTFTFEPKP
jgi:ribonuclease BN (tRNA processing enzyme)